MPKTRHSTKKHMMLKTVSKKNIFETARLCVKAKANGSSVIIPHVCNNVDLFGAGFAQAIAKEYPEVKKNYHLLGKKFLKEHPGYVQFLTVDYEPQYSRSLVIANMIAQNGIYGDKNLRPINYAYLVKSMIEVKKFCTLKFSDDHPVEIHCPKFGSGLAKGNWDFIELLIEDMWSDYKVTIHV